MIPRTAELNRSLEELAYYSKYATAIYGKYLINILIEKKVLDLFRKISDVKIFIRYAKLNSEDIKYHHIKSRRFLPGHAVCLDHKKKTIILCIRGTMSVHDCLTDLKGEYTPFDLVDPMTGELKAAGMVHMGIMTCARNLSKKLKTMILDECFNHPDYTLVIVGHSLGAGSAALLTLMWMNDVDFVAIPFKTYAYAPPAVVSTELNTYLTEKVTSCSYGNDLVARLSFGAIKDLVSMILSFHTREQTEELKGSEIVAKEMFSSGSFTDQEIIKIYDFLKQSFNNYKLEPPGNIYQIFHRLRHVDSKLLFNELSNTDIMYVGEFVDHSLYYDIVFSKTMLSDHMPNYYEEGLNALVYGGLDQDQIVITDEGVAETNEESSSTDEESSEVKNYLEEQS